ncbi:thioredoxin family protein, partial [Klebsiella pneumoniae]|nr:thioredoxin family protein [Klebsiella pneumoniae]
PCRESEAEYLQFAKKLGPHVKAGVVNVDKSPVLSTRYEVFGLPSVLVFRNGQLMKRITGQKTAEQYAAIFSSITEHE